MGKFRLIVAAVLILAVSGGSALAQELEISREGASAPASAPAPVPSSSAGSNPGGASGFGAPAGPSFGALQAPYQGFKLVIEGNPAKLSRALKGGADDYQEIDIGHRVVDFMPVILGDGTPLFLNETIRDLIKKNPAWASLSDSELAQRAYQAMYDLYETTRLKTGWDLPELSDSAWSEYHHNLLNGVYLYRVLAAPDEDSMFAAVRAAGAAMTAEEKILFFQKTGLLFDLNYDFKRAGPGTAPGVYSAFQMVHALNEGDISPSTRLGVCRDAADAQCELLSEMGFGRCFVLGYSTTGAGHATVVVGDPTRPHGILKYDYMDLSRVDDRSEVNALAQQGDLSLNYYIHEIDRKKNKHSFVAELPTELAIELADQSGENVREIDPFARITVPGAASARYDGPEGSRASLFVAQLDNGATVFGVASGAGWGDADEDVSGGRLSLGFFNEQGGMSEANVNRLYGSISQSLSTPWIGAGGAGFRIESRARLSGATNPVTGSAHLDVGAHGRYRDTSGKYAADLIAGDQLTPGLTDVRSDDPGDFSIYENLRYVRLEARREKIGGSGFVFLDVQMGFRELTGQQFQSFVGGGSDSFQVDGGYQGAVDPNALTIAPGTARQVSARGQIWIRRIDLKGSVEIALPIEYRKRVPGRRLRLKFEKDF